MQKKLSFFVQLITPGYHLKIWINKSIYMDKELKLRFFSNQFK